MAPMIQSQIPLVQPSPPLSAHSPQQFEIGSTSASVAESINVEANTDCASRFDPRDVITIEKRDFASFSGTSPATGHSHELENQLQLVLEENKLLRDQFKDLQDQYKKIQEQNQKMQEEMHRQMQEMMHRQMQEMQRQMQEQMKSQLAAFFRGTP